MFVCECCMMAAETGDDSSCRDYFDHTHANAAIPLGYVLSEDWQTTRSLVCDSCGGEIGAFGTVYHYTKI